MSEAATTTTEQKDGAATSAPPAKTEQKPSDKETTTEPEKKAEETTKEASTDSTSDKGTDDIAVDAVNLLAQGKRNLVCSEVPTAVNQLQEACKLLAIKYGDTADECAEAYFCYGKALLDLSRMESGVLGNALQGMSEDEEEDKSADSSEEKESLPDTESSESKEGETEEEGDSEDIGETEEEGPEEEGDSQEEGEEGAKKEEEDDVSNLQLAWEVLELAKIIYRRHDSKEMKLKLAETNLKLGEVGLETEQYEQALGDFHQCLKLQKELLEPEDRLLAETYYQLGLAATYSCRYDEAIEYYKSAATCIEAKIAQLNKILEEAEASGKGKEKADIDHPTYKADKEIKELQEILPDIMSKIDDVEDEKKSADKVKQLVKENVAQDMGTTTSGFGAAASSSADASSSTESTSQSKAKDISHLVRKKRKTEVEEEDTEEATKKQKTDESQDAEKKETKGEKATNGTEKSATNGAASNGQVNGQVNGKTSPEKTEIKTKTVEDVKQQKEETMETS